MIISIPQKLIFFSIIFLTCNGIIGYSVYDSNKKQRDSELWIRHSEQVIYQSGNIFSLVKDIEVAWRGFVLTKDSTFLVPLYTTISTIFVYTGELGQLIKNDPTQQQHLDSLNLYIHKRLGFSLLRNKKESVSAIAHVSAQQVKLYTDRLLQITISIQQKEASLLKQQKQTYKYNVAKFNLFSVIMFVLMMVISILLLIAFGNVLLQNKEMEKWADEMTRNKQFLNETGRVGRLGGWEIDLKKNILTWSDAVYRIHEVESDYQPTVKSAISFYSPEAISIIYKAVSQAINKGESYDIVFIISEYQ
jgi:CHASE3 domain sensor protein